MRAPPRGMSLRLVAMLLLLPTASVAGAPTSQPTLDPARLEAFLQRAEAEHTTALMIAVDDQVVHASGDTRTPVFAMSVTKSITALVLGVLVDRGRLDLDAPLSEGLVPEWSKGARAAVTLRHLMSQTSGLDKGRWLPKVAKAGGARCIEPHGLASAPRGAPGAAFAYNNNMGDFLAVIARRADAEGRGLAQIAEQALWGPLDAEGARWMRDPCGVERAAGEALVRPLDLLKLGQLVLWRGRWGAQRILSEAWIEAMLTPQPSAPHYGLLWWIDRSEDGAVVYRADGYLGQYILVIPRDRLVIARVRDPRKTSWDNEAWVWRGIVNDALALVGRPPRVRARARRASGG